MTDINLGDLRGQAEDLLKDGFPSERWAAARLLALLDMIAERDATIAAALDAWGDGMGSAVDRGIQAFDILDASDSSAVAERDRAVAERSWAEGVQVGFEYTNNGLSGHWTNPYAKEQTP